MLYIAKPPNFPYTSSTVILWIMNQFHIHSQKKQNAAKKFIKSGQIEIARRRKRWDRAVEARSSEGEIERRGAAIDERRGAAIEERRCCDRRSARCDRWTGARSVVVRLELGVRGRSLFFLSLCDLGSLSLSLSLSLFSKMLWSENRNWK